MDATRMQSLDAMARRAARRCRALTLVELLVVLAIVAVLAGLIAGGGLLGQDSARERKARSDLERIAGILLDHQQSRGFLPDTNAWFTAISSVADAPPLADPWESAYRYDRTGVHGFRVYSLGPDGAEGGEYDRDNIVAGHSR